MMNDIILFFSNIVAISSILFSWLGYFEMGVWLLYISKTADGYSLFGPYFQLSFCLRLRWTSFYYWVDRSKVLGYVLCKKL